MDFYDLNDIDNWKEPERPVEPSAPQPAPMPPRPEYAPPRYSYAPPAPPPRKRRSGWLVVLCILLLVALIAEPFALSMLRGEVRSLEEAEINSEGQLVLYYSDGSRENLGTVVGKDGINGSDGKDGVNGADGADGSAGTVVSGTGDVSAAAATGLRSSVSVYCGFVQEDRRGMTSTYYSAGSGVIYRINKAAGDAFVITNYHVVYSSSSRTDNGIAENIQLFLYGSETSGKGITATYVGGSQYYDIAILRVEDSELLRDSDACAVTVADSDAVQVGSTAIAIGNPESEGISVSTGVVSVDSEYITMTAADGYTSVEFRVMRIDAAVNSGNSGGGLFDSQGRLIGIVNAKINSDDVENIGYALPSTTVTAVADNIIDYCFGTDCETVQRALLGVTVTVADSSAVYDSSAGTMSIQETVTIYSVESNGLGNVFQVGDVVVSATLNGETKEITRRHHVIDLMLTARVGDVVTFFVLRDGVETTLTVQVTEACLTAY